ncbi:hypothetical protein JW926_03865 [Candidatus Sumerlaeota bacterium]|nr:hypothetical protein [Candidatus Sumerlaeota bacterium]
MGYNIKSYSIASKIKEWRVCFYVEGNVDYGATFIGFSGAVLVIGIVRGRWQNHACGFREIDLPIRMGNTAAGFLG